MAKCGSGGVGIFVKADLLKEWELGELDTNMEGLYFVSFINVQLDINLVLCPCYLPPENSSWALDSDLFSITLCLFYIQWQKKLICFYVEEISMLA